MAVVGGFVLAPKFAYSAEEVDPIDTSLAPTRYINLDLSDRDYAEEHLEGIIMINIGPGLLCPVNDSEDCMTRDQAVGEPETFYIRAPVTVQLEGPGLIEVGFTLAGIPETGPELPIYMDVQRIMSIGAEPAAPAGGTYRYTSAYREIVSQSENPTTWGRGWLIQAAVDAGLLYDTLAAHDEGDRLAYLGSLVGSNSVLGLLVYARRLQGDCVMSATISGDVNRRVFGDYAYFNVSEVPVKKGMMVGSMIEAENFEPIVANAPDVSSATEGALGLAAELGLMDEDEAAGARERLDETNRQDDSENERRDENVGGSGESFGEWMREGMRAEGEGDNFGLNLFDLKSDVIPKEDALAGAMLASAFQLNLSGAMDRSHMAEWPTEQPAEGEAERVVDVTPSTITATVGLSEKGGDRIGFQLPEGGQVGGVIRFHKQDPNYITGRFATELETKGPYILEDVTGETARKLNIQVDATFAARRGSLSCMR